MSAEGMSGKTFFSRDGCLFPEISYDKLIPTAPFLKAANQILPLFDRLGSGYIIVKNDVHGNIKKLEQKQSMNPELYVSLNAMLKDEATKKDSTQAQSGVLWLKRGIDYFCTLFEILMSDKEESTYLEPCLKAAYTQVLKPYHGFIVQQVFSVLSKLSPYKSQFLIKLKEDKSVDNDLVYDEMEVYIKLLRSNIVVLNDILKENGLESDDKTD
ncbi:hypothetical protein LOTGIDRAFT_236169 [Lottia gigantea]|uniref:Glycolipid transfer protein domain-containing protein n=1 Tax=Lottia gigantea TaxID=225164 RepID=V3Z261_LOTGI|nr:hypothetical protein LOTGIDRAFT_236169 [Lottia gigantea]ESO84658.1 hypothetical protein LOTGIDRAFT_236169 [Lottia gigantea]